MSASVTTQKDGIRQSLKAMLSRAGMVAGFMQRVTFEELKLAQEQRWITENQSEGSAWTRLDPTYASYKKKRWASSPGGGTKMMIASGTLVAAATGRGPGMIKLISDTSFVVSIDKGVVPYAEYAAETRPIMRFSDSTVNRWKKQIADYIFKGKERG